MSGFFTNGMKGLVLVPTTGVQLPADTGLAAGQNPETGAFDFVRMATWLKMMSETVDHATVAGSRYYRAYDIQWPCLLTGVQFLIGSVGGTDKIIVELHDSTGALLATSDTSGVTLGTAATVQQIPFYDNTNAVNLPYTVTQSALGTYYLVIQSNGTTGKYAAFDYPALGINTGSATGVFGTGAAITPPTTYTAGLAPFATPY